MIEFFAPHWSLDQAIAWAHTRHPGLVSWAAKPANFKGGPAALTARIGLYLDRAKKRGHDINADLWRTSGRPLPGEPPSAHDEGDDLSERRPDELQRQEPSETGDGAPVRLPLFPIEDHLVQLLRAGTIKSMAKRPSEDRYQDLSAADWVGLEIAEKVGLKVARSEGTYLFVLLAQPDVLREFPELPAAPKSPNVKPPDLMTVLRHGIEAKGHMLTQAEAEKIAREAGVTDDRKKIREGLKLLGGSDKTDPKGPRNKRAEPSA
jgi:hypothetical protein